MLQCRHAEEFSFGPRALKDALISTDPTLQELYANAFSSNEKLFLSEAYNPRRTLFCSLFIRTAFDWLLSHPDAPEDFETFYYALLKKKQRFCRKHIYLQPIDLSEGPVGLSLLDSLRSCVESFFLGLRVKCLPSVSISSIHCCYRHNQDSDRTQLHTDGILSFLKNNKPMDALCVLGLTLADLYPCETWSFTFGKFLPGQGHVPRDLSSDRLGELPLASVHHARSPQLGRNPAEAAGTLPDMPSEAAVRRGLQAHRALQETLHLDADNFIYLAQPRLYGAVRNGGHLATQRRLGDGL
ncbi:archaemetzincin-1 isoform X2 [Protobothrops mucrosquamatus]|uniref:archaemetzincin-1 isoform X2 n=1 Tax=Protobothrops mucrosquamatus TaxID=103944 RepID=UPI0010FB42EF|nr:archaemetzincin-1 isoform X2 [Protobothrops mucrosquamatus]